MARTTGVDPTELTAEIPGCSRILSTAALAPWTTLNTPSGRPASFHNSATSIDGEGSFSEGLRTDVFPAAITRGDSHIGTITGMLNGVIPAATPRCLQVDQHS